MAGAASGIFSEYTAYFFVCMKTENGEKPRIEPRFAPSLAAARKQTGTIVPVCLHDYYALFRIPFCWII